jgi:hypothetical protein
VASPRLEAYGARLLRWPATLPVPTSSIFAFEKPLLRRNERVAVRPA